MPRMRKIDKSLSRLNELMLTKCILYTINVYIIYMNEGDIRYTIYVREECYTLQEENN